jgi:aminopeptidase N
MVIAAAPLTYIDLGQSACGKSEFGCVSQSAYAFAEDRDFLPGPFAQSTAIVEWFSSLVGPFPYEKLAHLESSTRFGGMENASAIFYADAPIHSKRMGAGIVAHETAHQWFGDAVTEREWSHVWLSEGFATYFAHLWTQHTQGDSAFRAALAMNREMLEKSDVVATRPVIDSTQTELLDLLNANSYQKGGWVLHMLRRLVGDSAFFGGIRAYYAEHRHANAVTDDLRRAVETSSRRDLAWFFDQWLRRPGVPELTASWRYDAASRRVILEIEQSERFAPYRLPLTVEVVDAGGASRRTTIELSADRSQRVTLPLELQASPRTIRLDPDVDLLAHIVVR